MIIILDGRGLKGIVDLEYTPDGIKINYHGLVIGLVEILGPGQWRVNGMDYDRLHMAIRDVVRKFLAEHGQNDGSNTK